MAVLRVELGERLGETIPLDKDKTVFGRERDCDQVISREEVVSRHHAQIRRDGTRWFLHDLKSRNGTKLNGIEIPKGIDVPLKHRDVIAICEEFQATFYDADKDEEVAGTSTIEAMLSSSTDHNLKTQPAAKLAALLDITAKLSKTLELDAQLPEVADGLLKIFTQADRCFIILVDEDNGALVPKVIRTRAHVAESSKCFSRTIILQCLKSGQALLLREGDSVARNSESVSAFHIRSVMCVPLTTAEGKVFGVIQVDTQDANKKFTEEDLHLLWGVAYQASVAMENVHLHKLLLAQERVKNELDLARQVQLNFLPRHPPQVPGYEFYAFYEAAREVGGDYYDFITLAENRLAITLGDVAGKGMPAALLMAKLSSESRSCLLMERELTLAIAKLNDQLYPSTSPMDRFVTLIAAILDPCSHTLTLVNAGHPSPLWYHREERKVTAAIPAEDDGQSLGLNLGNSYQCYRVELQPGDFLLLYSDGVTDAHNKSGKPFRLKGIHSILEQAANDTAGAFGQRLVSAVQRHATGGPQYDDITLLCFGRPMKS
jgi:serine phosphatase RsbU (regulator of sigma subunit)